MDPERWSKEEFGDVDLKDARLDARLLLIARRVAESSGGTVAAVFRDAAERQAAYKFLSNQRVRWEDVATASHRACVERCAGEEFVFVPEDGSSLNITDTAHDKGTGPVGARNSGARGFQVMNLIAVRRSGVPLGLCGQGWWSRSEGRLTKSNKARPTEDKEIKHCGIEMAKARELFVQHGRGAIPWFQLDRGGDAWPVLMEAMNQGQWVTVRSSYDRRLVDGEDGTRRYLHETMAKAPILGDYRLGVRGGHGRTKRTALMQVRAAQVTLHMLDDRTSRKHDAPVWCVWAAEIGTTPAGADALEWMLLTTRSAATFADAKLTIYGYSLRWRIEEFHKAWKSGASNVEDIQLRSERAIRG